MTSPKAILTLLEGRVGQLEDRVIVEVSHLLEHGGDDQDALRGRSIIRPRLRRLRPRRSILPRRLFCLPFQGLLRDTPEHCTMAAHIARKHVAPAWEAIAEALGQQRLTAIQEKIAEQPGADTNKLREIGEPLWEAADQAIDKAIPTVSDPAVRAAMSTMRAAVRMRQKIWRVMEDLPGPAMTELEDRQITIACNMLEAALRVGPNEAYVVGTVIAMRLSPPSRLMGVMTAGGLGMSDPRSRAVLERFAADFNADLCQGIASYAERAASATPDAMVSELKSLTDGLAAMKGFAKRLEDDKVRESVAEALDNARKVGGDTVLPRLTGGVVDSIGQVLGNVANDGDDLTHARAVEENIIALQQCHGWAGHLDMVDKVEAASAELLAGVTAQAEDLLGRASSGDLTVRRQLMSLARYVEFLGGSELANSTLSGWLSRVAA